MDRAYVGYVNEVESATITASSTSSGFTAADGASWITADKWKGGVGSDTNWNASMGAATDVNAFGVAHHNLGDVGASVVVEGASHAGGSFTTVGTFAPNSGETVFLVTSTTHQNSYYRFRVTGPNSYPIVGNFFLGAAQALPAMERGFATPRMARSNDYVSQRSEGGEFLGRSILRRGRATEIEFTYRLPSWVDSVWIPFLDEIETHPFYFAWDTVDYPSDVMLAWTEDEIPPLTYRTNAYVRVRLPIFGV